MAVKLELYRVFKEVAETGTITMSGTGAELLADQRVKEAYLGKSN